MKKAKASAAATQRDGGGDGGRVGVFGAAMADVDEFEREEREDEEVEADPVADGCDAGHAWMLQVNGCRGMHAKLRDHLSVRRLDLFCNRLFCNRKRLCPAGRASCAEGDGLYRS